MIATLATHAGDASARPRSWQALHDSTSTSMPAAPSSSFYYFGGKVISRVDVVVVLWGSNVSSTVATKMGPFYQTIVASPYLDWLGEYDTVGVPTYDGSAGSNQHVYRGTYDSTVTISPSSSTSVGDSTIANAIDANIASNVLPAPKIDAEGGVDTIYMVYFPPGTVISDGQGGTSCNAGGGGQSFCGYHSTFQATVGGKTVSVPYGVIPSMSDYGCAQGCGGATELGSLTIASSHELAEAITDTEIGLTNGVGRPMGFYDANDGEIGDICENTSNSTDTIGGYTVQKNWSQRLGKCVAQDPSLPLCGSQRPCRPCTSADNGGACNGATPVCETGASSPKQGECVACTSSASCGAGAPVCDPTSDTCRGCKSDSECGGGKCDTSTGACVACLTSNDCTSSAKSICDASSHTCRGCEGNADCKSPEVCDPQAGTCVGCQSDADCANPNLPVCDTSSHTCTPKAGSPGDGATGSPDGGADQPGSGGNGDAPGSSGWGKASSCSASPGPSSGTGGALAALGLAITATLARRRRRV